MTTFTKHSVVRGFLALCSCVFFAGQVFAAAAADEQAVREVQFREPTATTYTIIEEPAAEGALRASGAPEWTRGRTSDSNTVEFSSRVVLQLLPFAGELDPILARHHLKLSRVVGPGLYILQAAGSKAAIDAAEALAKEAGVTASYPVMRRPLRKHGEKHTGYARKPNDPFFPELWHLENRREDRQLGGADLNVRAAWPMTRGENVLIAVVDDGFQLDHPDLESRAVDGPHYNFFEGTPDGRPATEEALHATAVAGLIAAEADNSEGVSGVAPESRLASWVIFGMTVFGLEGIATDEQLMDTFQYASNVVAVQNHSWGSSIGTQLPLDALVDTGIENAVKHGRDGKGVVMVRAGGNSRELLHNVNDDAYANDPRGIAVAAVRPDGRATSYSSAGACLLVAAPSGDFFADDLPPVPDPYGVLTTDLTGDAGYSSAPGVEGDYTLFDGTSASSPEIAGVVGLILSANTNATYRDVQQILVHSSRHIDRADPDVRTNGAGFLVSHNVGFGVPDAGQAVNLARNWPSRPALSEIRVTNSVVRAIPDDSLRVICAGAGVDASLESIRCLPSHGPHPDVATGTLPLVYVGGANAEITTDLRGKGALIERGESFFFEKIERAARAGAAFAVIFNNVGTIEIQPMGGTDYVPIPAVSIGRDDGIALRDLIANSTITARIQLSPTTYSFAIDESLLCEHVGLRLKTTHSSRTDVRVTLVSPMGTRSVLQRINTDDTRGPRDWTYWSVQHFYETSAGQWQLEVSDELNSIEQSFPVSTNSATGSVTYAEIIIRGVPIVDEDRDALDDRWEMLHFGDLSRGPKDDPDGDGWMNSREQIMATHPQQNDAPLQVEAVDLDPGYLRLSWPGREGQSYSLESNNTLDGSFAPIATVPGTFPITEHVVPSGANPAGFFVVGEAAAQGAAFAAPPPGQAGSKGSFR